MLLETLSALVMMSAAQADAPPPSDLLDRPHAGLFMAIRARCPPMEPKVRAAAPEEIKRLTTGFYDQLSSMNKQRLDKAMEDTGAMGRDLAGCGPKDSARCQARTHLSAIIDTDLMGAFADYVCARETAATVEAH
jgi:hypothetical protein